MEALDKRLALPSPFNNWFNLCSGHFLFFDAIYCSFQLNHGWTRNVMSQVLAASEKINLISIGVKYSFQKSELAMKFGCM